jgi:hypothetical protein
MAADLVLGSQEIQAVPRMMLLRVLLMCGLGYDHVQLPRGPQ